MKLLAKGTMKNFNEITGSKLQSARNLINKNQNHQFTPKNQAKTMSQQKSIDPFKLQQFIQQVRNINTFNFKATTPSVQNKSRQPEKLKDITDLSSKVLKMSDREDFQHFLNNNWLDYVIKEKSLRKDDGYQIFVNEQLKDKQYQEQIFEENQRRKHILSQYFKTNQKNDQTKFGIDDIFGNQNRNQDLSPLTERISQFQDYFIEKNRINTEKSKQNTLITKILNQQSEQINSHQLDLRLKDIDAEQQFKLKKRRIIIRLMQFAKQAIQQKKPISDVFTNFQLIIQLLSDKITNNRLFNEDDSLAIIELSKKGDLPKIINLLNENPKLINVYDEVFQIYIENFQSRMTSLHWSVKKQKLELVKFLLQRGAFVDSFDIFQQTPLYFALENNNIQLITILLTNGASAWIYRYPNYQTLIKSKRIRYLIKFSQYLSIFNKISLEIEEKFFIEEMNDSQIIEKILQFQRIMF